ncbi:hypothetical protein M406DRAFT_356656 [Cryphonectria parasitica EP155]|uniref:Secreted protein n=1 Tax=Cryphonectria parasitica (strain ATCC 38755 / EP155) TaxID=660469 RepID=A0A9P4Y1F8_CRYP1|nr:uncharacterized protein M406DRAFT_356656 [Cryphonectria parasitica EP155]KAF3764759.1 hypothetical protein M406DRAFT_356656 [Cryphonectria parasitica EP155]
MAFFCFYLFSFPTSLSLSSGSPALLFIPNSRRALWLAQIRGNAADFDVIFELEDLGLPSPSQSSSLTLIVPLQAAQLFARYQGRGWGCCVRLE